MTVLVTGACGYKGTVLVPKLSRYAHEVIALDTTMFFGGRVLLAGQPDVLRK